MKDELRELAQLLERRLAVIADHELRARDSAEHLRQLREVSESIMERGAALKPRLDARLNHFLTNCSYDKALDWIRGLLAE